MSGNAWYPIAPTTSDKPVWMLTADEIAAMPPVDQKIAVEHRAYLERSGSLAIILAHPPGTVFKTVHDGAFGWKLAVDGEAMDWDWSRCICRGDGKHAEFDIYFGPFENSKWPTIVRDDPHGGDPHILCELRRVYRPDDLREMCRLANLTLHKSGMPS